MSDKDLKILSDDKPLSDPQNDLLGGRYAAFAKYIAEQICKMAPADGFVIAINGDWGSGKSTALNFVEHYLNEVNDTEKPIIVRFNPWWFSGRDDLIRIFFDQLLFTLNREKYDEEELRKKISEYANVVTEVPYLKILSSIGKFLKPNNKITTLKKNIERELSNNKKKILVIIDDIDRLTAKESKQIFQVIKAVADFPYITYLLAFDRKVVAKALTVNQDEREGFSYLEKIVQVPYELPMLDKYHLRQMFFKRLDKIIGEFPSDLFDKEYWSSLYNAGIDNFIRTPRSVVRFINALHATYPVVKGEVNISDFVGIESIRIFHPRVYDLIRYNPQMFYGEISDGVHLISSLEYTHAPASILKPFHEKWVGDVQESDRDALRNLVIMLFPKLNKLEEGSITSFWSVPFKSSRPEDWRRQRRICDPGSFYVYFRYGITKEELSRGEVIGLLAKGKNPEDFRDGLIALGKSIRRDGTSKARAFLERMYDYTASEIPDEHIRPILEVLFDIGDQLLRPEDEPSDPFNMDNAHWIVSIILQLIRRLNKKERKRVLQECIENGKALYIQAHVVTIFGWQHGLYGERNAAPEDERILDLKDIEGLSMIALTKVKDSAANGSLANVPELGRVLFRWKDWADEQEVKEWVHMAIKSDEGLSKIVESFGLPLSTDYNLRDLGNFVNPTDIANDVKKLIKKNGISERQKQILKKFIEAFEAKNKT